MQRYQEILEQRLSGGWECSEEAVLSYLLLLTTFCWAFAISKRLFTL